MSAGSFRSRLLAGSVLWTLGVMLVIAVALVTFLATHPQPHRTLFDSFIAVPLVVSLAIGGTPNGLRAPVAPAVDGLFRALGRLHAERGLMFEQDVAADHAVRCAPEDLDEMLGNLLDNACTWGRARVRVSSSRHDDHIALMVDDDGEGLDPALMPRMLQRGVRADERVPGSGLGLAIAHDLVELYGGSLALDRSPLGGLRVRLTLPGGAG